MLQTRELFDSLASRADHLDSQILATAADALSQCEQAVSACAAGMLAEKDGDELALAINRDLDCVDVVAATRRVMTRGTDPDHALLSLLTRLSGGKAVVEVGTGAGVSGLWLLSGMREDGVLTTIDIEPEHQRMAKQAFSEGGIGPSRTRLISGRAQEVLTRLADHSYDLVFIDADPADQADFVIEGIRLLRSGGVIVVHRAALGGRAGDPSASDAEVTAVREAARLIAEDERFTPVLVPLGDGILAAARD